MSQLLPTDAATLATITARIHALRSQAAGELYELGVLLRRVQDEQLWRAGDYTSFSDYLQRGADVSRTTALRCVAVARHFNLDIAQRYGLDKLSLGLRYLELTGKDEQPGDLIAAELRNRGPDGRFMAVPFHEATRDQIEEAIAIERGRQRSSERRAPDDVARRVDALAKRLPALPMGARPAKRRVETTKTARGEVLFTFKQIPLSELRAFLAAVERELLGDAEVA